MSFDPEKTPWVVCDGRNDTPFAYFATEKEAVDKLNSMVVEHLGKITVPNRLFLSYVIKITHMIVRTPLPIGLAVTKVGG